MKILFVHNQGSPSLPSGETIVLQDQCNGLKKIGHQVAIYYVENDIDQHSSTSKRILSGFNLIFSIKHFFGTLNLINTFKPDIVHFHSILPNISVSAIIACRLKKIRTVQTLHNYRWICIEGGLFRNDKICMECIGNSMFGIKHLCVQNHFLASVALTANNFLYVKSGILNRLIDMFLPTSRYVEQQHFHAGFGKDKLSVIYNGVRKPNISFNSYSRNEKNEITFVGRLSRSKGVSFLFKIAETFPEYTLNIIGDGPEYINIEKIAITQKNVVIHGKLVREQINAIIMKSLCVVIPSIFPEPFGLVAIESLMLKTPIVAFSSGGLSEIIATSGGGLAVERHLGVKGLVDAILTLINDRQLAQKMGEDGFLYCTEHFSIERHIQTLDNCYNLLVNYANEPVSR